MKLDSTRGDLLVWLALLALLALTCASAFIPLRGFNMAANLVIAALKALVVAVFFMRLGSASVPVRIVAIAGFVWLFFLFVLSLNDFATRGA